MCRDVQQRPAPSCHVFLSYPSWNPDAYSDATPLSHHKPLREHASPPLPGPEPLGEGHGKEEQAYGWGASLETRRCWGRRSFKRLGIAWG